MGGAGREGVGGRGVGAVVGGREVGRAAAKEENDKGVGRSGRSSREGKYRM